ncbi:MAG: YedE-related selenium metabolism membrane protein [Actinomycetia bacterium]|nr:YedE-related selenium metabolism membrane protein [Actinomycetes bacterium]
MKKDWLFIISAGLIIGISAIILVLKGNPPNMGFCIACFERDIAGALGLHRASVVQYLRPEILGILFGALIIAFMFKEFKPEGGSSPMLRFFIGIFIMIGSLVFLGCPIRMTLRLGGGDLNALVGLLGIIAGIFIASMFLKAGFDLGRAKKVNKSDAYILPLIFLALLGFLLFKPIFNPDAGGPIFFSTEGPGAMVAPIIFSIVAGLLVGVIGQRSRFCTIGGIRDFILFKDTHLLTGLIVLFLTVLFGNLVFGKFNLGFVGQPIAHNWHIWNFLGLALAGWGSVFLGGCPFRQLILSANGNTDSAITVMGMVVGAAVSHNFVLAASPKGVPVYGQVAVIIGLIFLLIMGFLNLEKS